MVCVMCVSVGRGWWRECPRVIHQDLEKMVKNHEKSAGRNFMLGREKINIYWQKRKKSVHFLFNSVQQSLVNSYFYSWKQRRSSEAYFGEKL